MKEKRVKPILNKKEQKQVHFEVDLDLYLEFERIVYGKGYTVAEYYRNVTKEVVENKL